MHLLRCPRQGRAIVQPACVSKTTETIDCIRRPAVPAFLLPPLPLLPARLPSPSSFFPMQLHRRCRSRRCLITVNNRCVPDTAAAALRLRSFDFGRSRQSGRKAPSLRRYRSARLADPSRAEIPRRFPSSLRAPFCEIVV